ncbi:MAG: metallophosphoesterase [Candidatus Obscuribacterales bacterium]|nr:metallophosphoesterase [Candidatus Obscuribacterales bacterium]
MQKSRTNSGRRRSRRPEGFFLIEPYLQLGDRPQLADRESLELHFYIPLKLKDASWKVEYKQPQERVWQSTDKPSGQKITIDGIKKSQRLVALLRDLEPGATYDYRVMCDDKIVFNARAKARKGRGQDYRFVIVGDIAEGSEATKKVAYEIAKTNPDFIVLAGDIAYKYGRLSEYLSRFFPVYNSDNESPDCGAPLLRSIPTVSVIGNHDVGMPNATDVPDFDWHADLLAQFVFWSQPLNGPLAKGEESSVPKPRGKKRRKRDFYAASGDNFPRMANYSLDVGDTHWLMLDANVYVDWSDSKLRDWVDADLTAAKNANWKLVCVHQPPFSSDRKHAEEQRIRNLADIFEKHGVSVVFAGHYHAYERSYPLNFKAKPQANGKMISDRGEVDGDFSFDKTYDGDKQSKPQGILYLVTGGGGAKLYLSPERRADPNALPPFTFKLVDETHSFTCCDVSTKQLTFRQISEDGNVLDRFSITK